MTPNTLTPEQQKAARQQAKSNKAKQQRAEKAAALTALERAKLEVRHTAKNLTIEVKQGDGFVTLTPEQKKRAATFTAGHAGLSGKALATYILEGKNANAQTAEARQADKDAKKADKQRKNLSRSNDPAAAELAQKAAALAPDVRSAFLPKDARECLDILQVAADGPKTITVTRGDVVVEFNREKLESFSIGGDKDKGVRGDLARLAKDSRLWGRKLGLMILVRAAA